MRNGRTTSLKEKVNEKILKVSMNIKKNVQTFRAEPFICVKKPIAASWHTPYKKPNGERALARNVRARETQLWNRNA